MSNRHGSALVVAILALMLAGVVAAGLAELARLTGERTRLQQHATRAWFLAEAGLADTLATLLPGRSFSDDLATGASAARASGSWSYQRRLRDDADDAPDDPAVDVNERIVAQVEARGPTPVRRRLEAVIGREPEPFLPGAATLAGGVRELTRDFVLDGRDFRMSSGCAAAGTGRTRAGLAMPEGYELPPLDPARILGRGGPGSVRYVAPPDLTPLADAAGATPHPAGVVAGTLGTLAAPRFTVVQGDAEVATTARGAGVLYVAGRLAVRGRLEFTGVVAAQAGIDVAAGAALAVCGALWASGAPALAVRGQGAVRSSTEAIAAAGRVAPLPARAAVLATRELFSRVFPTAIGGSHG